MKEFRKNEHNSFICEECGEIFKRCVYLSIHIGKYHNKKEYFDKWIKDENDGNCEICGNETQFSNFGDGYKKCCSNKCTSILRKNTCLKKYGIESISQLVEIKRRKEETCLKNHGVKSGWNSKKSKQTKKEKYGEENYNNFEKGKQTCLIKYGVERPLQNNEIHKKFEQTCLEKYGVKNPYQSKENKEKIKESNFKNNGVEYPQQSEVIRKKGKQTNLEKYGVENVFQNEQIKEKCKQTSLRNNGVEYAQQNTEIFEKSQKTRFKVKKYKDTEIWYQGSYELDFLEKYFEKFKIQRGPSIKYEYQGKTKVYHPDFYITSLNLIVECKNGYLEKKDIKQNKEKELAVISNGLNFIMIIDKNYSQLEEKLKHNV